MKIKKIISMALLLILLSVNNISKAKYIFDFEFEVADLNIDRTKPIIEYISVSNSNNAYWGQADSKHTIKIKIKITEKNPQKEILNSDKIKVLLNNEISDKNERSIELIEQNGENYTYEIILKKITQNGVLKILLEEGAVTDIGGLQSKEMVINTQIIIVNVSLTGKTKIQKNGMMYSDHFFFFFYGQKNFFMLI